MIVLIGCPVFSKGNYYYYFIAQNFELRTRSYILKRAIFDFLVNLRNFFQYCSTLRTHNVGLLVLKCTI